MRLLLKLFASLCVGILMSLSIGVKCSLVAHSISIHCNNNNNYNISTIYNNNNNIIIMTTNHRSISRRRSISDGDIKEVSKDSSIVSRSHSTSTFGNMCIWLKKRRKLIGFNRSQSEDDVDALERSSSSLSTVKMNDQYRSSTSLKNLVDNDSDEVAMLEAEADDSQPQNYNTDDTDDPLDDSLSTVKMSELSLTSRHLVHEALEYERCVRTQTVA